MSLYQIHEFNVPIATLEVHVELFSVGETLERHASLVFCRRNCEHVMVCKKKHSHRFPVTCCINFCQCHKYMFITLITHFACDGVEIADACLTNIYMGNILGCVLRASAHKTNGDREVVTALRQSILFTNCHKDWWDTAPVIELISSLIESPRHFLFIVKQTM